jgi:cobalamin synthase
MTAIPHARVALGLQPETDLDDRRPPPAYLVAMTGLIAVLALANGTWYLACALVAFVVTAAAGVTLKGRLGGGLTGDVYGFLIACAEVLLLTCAAVLPR